MPRSKPTYISGGPASYWAQLTPAERKAEMQRRMAARKRNQLKQKEGVEEVVNSVKKLTENIPDNVVVSMRADDVIQHAKDLMSQAEVMKIETDGSITVILRKEAA